MQEILQRATLLYQQGRYDHAESESRRLLTLDPTVARGHALLALCLMRREAHKDALFEAFEAVRLDPMDAFNHYVCGTVLLSTERDVEALQAANMAVSMEPFNSSFHALVAGIHLHRRRWSEALAAAEQGLSSDPEDVECNNYRVMALVKLGRRDQAAASMGETLALDPEDAYSHANQGWTLLHEGKPKEAMNHFKEALRIDPTMDWARGGIVEALKAHNFIYRWMLAYFLFMSKLSARAQWGIIFGGWIGIQLLQNIGRNAPNLRPLITPIVVAYSIFAIMTWLAYPFFNLLLRLSRYGRLALSREQTIASNWVGLALLLAVGMAVAALVTRREIFLDLAIMFGLLTLPVAAFFNMDRGWPRWTMAGAIGVLLLIMGLHVLVVVLAQAPDARGWFGFFALSVLAITILANALGQVRVKKG
jgi:tetratricopeptide (TPR) repeat protein